MKRKIGPASIEVNGRTLREIDAIFKEGATAGARYPEATLAETDTEEFGLAGRSPAAGPRAR